MAGSLTNGGTYDAAKKVLDHLLLTGGAYSPPATLYVALFTDDPGETGAVTNEVGGAAYTGYARTAISFGAAVGRTITQDAQVTFPNCTAGTGAHVSHWGIMASDVETTDDMIAHGEFTTHKDISAGYTPFVESGGVAVTFSAGGISTAYATIVLDWLFDAGSLTRGTHRYIALFSDACSDAAAGTELTGSAYARIVCDVWDAATAGVTANTNAIIFAQADGAWTAATHMALYDHVSNATNYMFWNNCNDLTVLDDEYARVIAGAFDITLT